MNKKLEKGITLIALIITIIVLLILAGVSIATLTGENGLLNKAETAKVETTKAEAEEQVKLAIMASYNSSGKIDLGELKTNLNNIKGITGVPDEITDDSFPLTVTINGQDVQINKSGNTMTAVATGGTTTPSTPEEPTLYTAYNIGDEVTVGEESFYVLEASDVNTETVTLLSKYNLNTDGTAQSDAPYSDTECAFSSTNYWLDDFTGYSFDLNDLGKESTGDAIAIAKRYATDRGAISGRLLTINEVNTLKDSYGDMIWGTEATDGYLLYWLGSASTTDWVVCVNGNGNSDNNASYDEVDGNGIRPVITISKSLVL